MAASSAGAAPEVPVVRCLKDAFAWPFHALQTVGRRFGEAAGGKVNAALLNNHLSISTCFSGVDAPGVAIDMLAAELKEAVKKRRSRRAAPTTEDGGRGVR